MPRFSAHVGYLFSELPLEERFEAAVKAGFDVVEHPSPYAIPAETVRRMLSNLGLELAQISLPAGDAAKGEKGMAVLPGREDDFRASLKTGVEYAATAGARFIHVPSGLTPPKVEAERLWEVYMTNLSAAADEGAKSGLEVLIEPIGRATVEGYYMSRSDLALRAIAESRKPNLKLMFDVFHSSNDAVEPLKFIEQNVASIGHLHIADFPGRHQPGTGTLDFDLLFRTLDKLGYRGAVGCEYKPSGATLDSLAWFSPYKKTGGRKIFSAFALRYSAALSRSILGQTPLVVGFTAPLAPFAPLRSWTGDTQCQSRKAKLSSALRW